MHTCIFDFMLMRGQYAFAYIRIYLCNLNVILKERSNFFFFDIGSVCGRIGVHWYSLLLLINYFLFQRISPLAITGPVMPYLLTILNHFIKF